MCVKNILVAMKKLHILNLLGVLLFVSIARAEKLFTTETYGYFNDAVEFMDECGSKSLSLCFKERALTYIDQLPANVEVGGTFIVKGTSNKISNNGNDKAGRRLNSLTALPDEPRAREEMLDNILVERIYDYFTMHTFEFKIPMESVRELKRSFMDEARKKKDKKGTSVLLLFQLGASAIGALFLKIVAVVAFKALLVAKVALTIASVIGLKKLLEGKQHSSYEVVAHPYVSEEHIHGRSFSGQKIAYRGQERTKDILNEKIY